jgi:hypothetical protein
MHTYNQINQELCILINIKKLLLTITKNKIEQIKKHI